MNVVIFGGTGSLGHALTEVIRDKTWPNICNVYIVSRCELRQKDHEKKFGCHKYILGDVSNTDWWDKLPRRADYVINLAASKHVEVCEANVEYAVKVNYEGVVNTYKYSRFAGAKYLFTSTDKAVRPINAYGMAKALGQKYLQDKDDATTFLYGNVLGSRGSVLHKFRDAILKGEKPKLTHYDMTRFWVHIDDIANLIWDERNTIKPLVIPEMKAATTEALGDAVAEYEGATEPEYEVIGFRPGEKLHEEISYDPENDRAISSVSIERFNSSQLETLVARVLK